MKKIKKILLALLCVVVILGVGVGVLFASYSPTIVADFSNKTGQVTSGASGYLYGLAQPGVPSENMTESVDISTVSQKVYGGLQHPIGDINDVHKQLENTDYSVVYLQDAYSTWYYDHANIEQLRADNKYDWKSYIENDYFPRVQEAVEKLSKTDYSDKVVYCLYNECDNGVWFGETTKGDDGNIYGAYNEQGASNFFEAWKMTYDLVRSIDSNALIGGPGFCDFEYNKINNFLEYCVKNDCVPDVMIYHELNDASIRWWNQHIADYREIEKSNSVDELPIIITEYGRMCDNGMPGQMVQFVTRIEDSKVYGDNAYWRLADNLNDVCADDNMPNSNWWLYRWYADMEGQTVKTDFVDLFNSNFENAFIKKKEMYSTWGFMGVASITDNEDKIDVVCGGGEGTVRVKFNNLDSTNLKNKTVKITVEEAVYHGISGEVSAPVIRFVEYKKAGSSLTLKVKDTELCNAYHITVEECENADDTYKNEDFSKRFEFENGTILGSSYTYDSAYATTGEISGMVGGIENEGDGVKLTFNVPKDAEYNLNLIFGNANDGAWNENGKQNPDDRVDSVVNFELDDEKSELSFPNTIKSEYTDCLTLPAVSLSKGEHTITITHNTGTIVLDSLLVTENTEKEVAVLTDFDRTTDSVKSFLVVAPVDSKYLINTGISASARLNKADVKLDEKGTLLYLQRGLNYIDVDTADSITLTASISDDTNNQYKSSITDIALSDGAKIEKNAHTGNSYLTGISCDNGKAEYKVDASEAGTYAMTIRYANNEEGGKHDYNVDLIERYVTVTANGKTQDLFCRSTYSWDTCKTVTCYVELNKGSNTISLTNSGNNKFDNQKTYIPSIYDITLTKIYS